MSMPHPSSAPDGTRPSGHESAQSVRHESAQSAGRGGAPAWMWTTSKVPSCSQRRTRAADRKPK
ncbi:hypothetical protein, partial [Streptomyces sp. NPDC002516]